MANTYSLDLEGTSSQYAYITDANQTGLDISGDFSFECWLNLSSQPPAGAFTLISKWDEGNALSYIVEILNNNKIRVGYSSDGSTQSLISTDAAAFGAGDVGTWNHIACAVDVSASDAIIYKNLSELASTPSGSQTSIFNSAEMFAIGAAQTSGTANNFLNAKIDEVRIWNDIRSLAEFTTNYKKTQGFVVGTDNLVEIWRMENGYTSLSGNNTLTPSGSPVFSTDVPFTEGGGFLSLI